MRKDVFICHSSKDAEVATNVCVALEKNSELECWIAPRNIIGGKLYAQEIIEAIEGAQVFVLIYSTNTNLSNHVLSELNCAFNAGKIILPFCVDDSKMSNIIMYYANPSQSVIGYPDPEKHFAQLEEAVKRNIPELQKELERQRLFDMLSEETGVKKDILMSVINKAMTLGQFTKNASNNSVCEFNIAICSGNNDMDYDREMLYAALNNSGLHFWDAAKNIKPDIPIVEQICSMISQVSAYLCLYNGNLSSIMQRTTDIAFAFGKPMFLCRTDSSRLNNDFTESFKANRVSDLYNKDSFDSLISDLKSLCISNSIDQTCGEYDMLQNAEGEILIIIEKRESAPESPRLLYDGGDRALLYRNKESALKLNNIDEKARPALMAVDEILIAEIENEDVLREYKVPLRKVTSLKEI